jgi:hypothetical protein
MLQGLCTAKILVYAGVTDHFILVYADFGYQEVSPPETTTSGIRAGVSSHSDKMWRNHTHCTAPRIHHNFISVWNPVHLCGNHSRAQAETFCSKRAFGPSAYMLENTYFKNSLLATSKNTARVENHRLCGYTGAFHCVMYFVLHASEGYDTGSVHKYYAYTTRFSYKVYILCSDLPVMG